uniref:Uncharacterized protein n=1 Tax=Malurus cyaneus samueli TaxID=2593467 RepID=A0A8C5TFK7_9PASS
MAEHGPAGSLRAEASCSLCLGLFQDPVSIHCGHNFCRGCIERCWESSRESFPCPRCRETAPERSLRPNRELAKIIGIAQRLSLRAGSRSAEGLCQRHGEALKLFCEEEQTPVCRVCRESREHRLHAAVPIEEAAEDSHSSPTSPYFCGENFLSRLEKQNASEPVETLPEVAEDPRAAPEKFHPQRDAEEVPRYGGDQGRGLEAVLVPPLEITAQSLTLDPDTAHPRLALSQDGKSVWWEDTRRAVPDHPKRFDSSRCVLGREGFGSGRHYWEVRVGTGAAWAVGVAKESVRRKGRISVKPEVGIWAVGQCGSQCQALTSPLSPSPCLKPPREIGQRMGTIGVIRAMPPEAFPGTWTSGCLDIWGAPPSSPGAIRIISLHPHPPRAFPGARTRGVLWGKILESIGVRIWGSSASSPGDFWVEFPGPSGSCPGVCWSRIPK